MISTRALTYSYGDGTRAVVDVDLRVERGEFTAVMGANGSGKTTLLKLLIGLLKPASGSIFLEGRELRTLKDTDIFQRIGMVFQDPNDQLFAPTVEEDVAFGVMNLGASRSETARIVDSTLDTLGISGLRNKAVHALSFGQKRRVALAGVLAMKPSVILLDEPTGGLDPLGVTSIMSLLHNLNREHRISMIMATHDIDLVPLFCDSMVIMHGGRALTQGRPSDVLKNTGIIRQASLRLPRIAHLFEILREKDRFAVDALPLTIGEARRELLEPSKSMAGPIAEIADRPEVLL
jgi:cobalt/nickel transport system ATP-binding protein